ncbi:sodium:solute symporter family protein [Halomonas icarae]|uniref:Sodium:solute symporter family protein n=1 Tax=Halomonas icarae TaxID=2691040 RepID=A0A7X4W1K1_9GAMM|nr:sodium:solute symporter family protein [Halomonas icarae]MDR5903444.1 sodium:solute symporter family protein [Halomonas icarae]NAW14302.1 sodium:solute symporter family protein [Halomonas icarae]
MNIYFWGLLASLAIYLLVGNYAGRKVKGLDDYFVAGRRAPTLLIVGTLVASFLSTNAFLAETGFAYDGYAFLMLALVGVNTSGYVIGAVFFGRFVRRSRALTIPEFFAKRFDSRAMQVLAGVTTVIGLTAYLLAVTQGGSILIADVAGIPTGVALVLMWLGYMIFTLYSGSRGVMLTDTIMFLLFTLVSILALPYLFGEGGSWQSTLTALATYEDKPGIIAWHGLTGEGAYWASGREALIWALVLGASWSLVLAVSPWQTSRYLMARSEHVVVRSACISGLVLAGLYVVLMFGGAAINLANPDISPSERVMVWAGMNMMPTLLGTLLISGIMAAALSSCSTFLSLIGFSVSNDILKTSRKEDSKALRTSRIIMFAAATISLLLAYFQPPAVMWITYFAGTLFASSWGPVAFLCIWNRRITAPAAFVGMLVGFVVNIGAKLLDQAGVVSLPVYLDPFILGFVTNLVCLLVISRVTRPRDAALRYFDELHRTPEEELDPVEVNKTLAWPLVVMVAGLVIAGLLVTFYAIPYATAQGRDFHLFSGEGLLSMGYGFSVFCVGLLAFWQVKRVYGRKSQRREPTHQAAEAQQ